MKHFECKKEGKYTYALTLRVNVKVLCAILALALAVAAGVAIAWGLWLFIAKFWPWLLGALGAGLLIWALTKVPWHKAKMPEMSNIPWKKILGVLGILAAAALIVGLLFGLRGCEKEEERHGVIIEDSADFTNEIYDVLDDVVIMRAWLDGVDTNSDLGAFGLKYVGTERVTEKDFAGMTYEEVRSLMAEDWRELLLESLGGLEFSKPRLTAIVLFAMRNGKHGFTVSDFITSSKSGEIENLDEHMALHKANGEVRKLGEEAQQYLWVLKAMWRGNLSAQDVLDWPILSYRKVELSALYEGGSYEGEPLWNSAIQKRLSSGAGETPRQALQRVYGLSF